MRALKLPMVSVDRIAGGRPFQVRGAASLNVLATVFFLVTGIKNKFVPEERKLLEKRDTLIDGGI